MARPVVLKLGGELVEEPAHLKSAVDAIAAVRRSTPLVVVHGGGREIDAALKVAGIEKRQVDGLRITDDSTWDREALTIEFSEILELAPEIGLELSGFEMGEIDALLDGGGLDEEDELLPIEDGVAPVTHAPCRGSGESPPLHLSLGLRPERPG